MSNTNLTIDWITNEAQRIAHEKAAFLGTINRQFDESFGQSGRKIDGTLRVRLPVQYTRTQGTRVADVQDSTDQSVNLTLATQDHVAMRFNSAELLLDKDDFSQRHIQPAVSVLMSGVESDVLQGCTKATSQVAGTAGTAISDLTAPGAARAKLNQQLAPKDGQRAIQMDSITMGTLAKGTQGLFNPTSAISEQYREGFIARMAMADFYENERTWSMPNSADVSGGTLDTYTIVDADSTLTVTGITTTPVVGMVFTLAGVYDCHPETKAAYGHLKQFTVIAPASQTAFVVSPTIYLTGARKNVCGATGADLDVTTTTTAALVWVGAATTNYPQSLMYHKDAFAFVTGELPLMGDAIRCVRKTVDGISLRVWQASDIRNDEQITRIDILYGYAAIRPQWACRMIGSAAA